MKKEHTVSYSTEQITTMLARGADKSDFVAADAMAESQLAAAIAGDAEEAGLEWDWAKLSSALPQAKAVLNMRVDQAVLDFFRQQGKGYQTRINAVLRAYVTQMQRRTGRR